MHYDGKVYVICARKIVLLDILSPTAFTMFTSLAAVARAVVSPPSQPGLWAYSTGAGALLAA